MPYYNVNPYKEEFPDILNSYIDQIIDAKKNKKHHDYFRHLFTNFLRQGFDINPVEIEIEEKLKVDEVRGFIDAFFNSAIIEFKIDLERERPDALIELVKYFKSRPRPSDYIAVVTDGLSFELYQYNEPTPFDTFKLNKSDPLSAFLNIDKIVFRSTSTKPTSKDIVQKFGLRSPTYNTCKQHLNLFLSDVKDETVVKTKLKEWNTLLAKVYGTELGDEDLFIKHTYLTMFSRLLVAHALFPKEKRYTRDYRGLLDGNYFSKRKLPNLAEPDFFSWALDTEAEKGFLGFLSKLDHHFKSYDLSLLSEDILKELYQEMVDPASRHSLGEYYTPDWLAELTLDLIDYKTGKILDPACGSGSFLFSAIKRKRACGLSGKSLLKAVLASVIGIDVHPLAVLMAKANILLALSKEIKENQDEEIYLPVYMADSLVYLESQKMPFVEVHSEFDKFRIPFETINKTGFNLDKFIDDLSVFAHQAAESDDIESAFKGLLRKTKVEFSKDEIMWWKTNFRLLTKLIKNKRNSIWPFILKNAYRPAFLRSEKVDYVVGNPPWLAYRYIKDAEYKARIKDLTFAYELLGKSEVKLFTQMDTSTLFFVYCIKEFLKPEGTIAFVLPKTSILPAKQHASFQEVGFSSIHDFSDVSPLFNVRSVVLIRNNDEILHSKIPITFYSGKLPYKNLEWDKAKKFIETQKESFGFLDTDIHSPYYYQSFLQGATLVPRCFWFVQPAKDARPNIDIPYLETSDDAYEESKEKAGWKLKHDGQIEKEYLYETVLAKGLLPFAIARRELVFLPVKKLEDRAVMVGHKQLLEDGNIHSAKWVKFAEKRWDAKNEKMKIYERLNYHNTLISQKIDAKYVVLYNTSGTNLTAALFISAKSNNTLPINGFIADAKTYYYYPESLKEGDYICAVLNSAIVNEMIKAYQPEGLYGPRDIHRRPFEVCPIAVFDEKNSDHVMLAELGKKCREEMKAIVPKLNGRLGGVRLDCRDIIAHELREINSLVNSLFKKEGFGEFTPKARRKKIKEPDLFDFDKKV